MCYFSCCFIGFVFNFYFLIRRCTLVLICIITCKYFNKSCMYALFLSSFHVHYKDHSKNSHTSEYHIWFHIHTHNRLWLLWSNCSVKNKWFHFNNKTLNIIETWINLSIHLLYLLLSQDTIFFGFVQLLIVQFDVTQPAEGLNTDFILTLPWWVWGEPLLPSKHSLDFHTWIYHVWLLKKATIGKSLGNVATAAFVYEIVPLILFFEYLKNHCSNCFKNL